jgi:cell wall-associated NlpC family hydrolase
LPLDANKYRHVLKDLAVDKSPRYKARDGKTYCNIFLWDYTRAMGCEIPHWTFKDGSDATPGAQGALELNANRTVEWLDTHGANRGWVSADRKTSFDAASRGHVVVLGWHSGSSKPGHVAVLLPEGTIAQAGRRNFVGETVEQGFGKLPVRYWIQARGPHSAT